MHLQVRIGIHTGLVVVGDMDAEEELETMAVVGETPNVAARLQDLAEPDVLVVSAQPAGRAVLSARCPSLGTSPGCRLALPWRIA